MGRIKKAATERHMATLSPFVKDFVKRATETTLHQLPALLDSFPQYWPLPRGDLYHWIPLLDRFDHILELFVKEYALNEGPQTQPFGRRLLEKGDAEEGMPYPSTGSNAPELDGEGYSAEGDRELVQSALHFTRILLEHCGNRSLYASSSHINDLLHTTSLSLLRQCLKLSLRCAQRYQVARFKNLHPSAQGFLLSNHYSISLDNMNRIAQPFPKPYNSGAPLGQTPGKGKDKASQPTPFNPSDLVAIAKDPMPPATRNELSSVALSFYDQPTTTPQQGQPPVHQPSEASPSTPTPTRRTSTLGPSRDRPSPGDRSVSANDVSTPTKSRETDSSSNAPKLFLIPANKVAETPAWQLVKDAISNITPEMRYELLNRIRIAKAFAAQEVSNQEILEIRLLAIANLAYALPEPKFQEKIGNPDHEEPRRYHLAHQLCDLLQPATNSQTALTLQTENTAIMTLEALCKSRHKAFEVQEALAIGLNHGVLYYELRKVISTLNVDEHSDKSAELQEAEWRDSTFDLINSLLSSNAQARYGEKMVSAGIMGILVEALSLRTRRAEKFHERVLQFFDTFIHGVSTAFQTLASVKGLDIIADLTAFEVDAALEHVRNGKGLPQEFKSKVVDYEIPFYQQSTLRQLFKNTGHMFEHSAGSHDRLLRNLIDTPQILGALRQVIENARIFGSNVWGGAVTIVTQFIHHEPTSYQVIGEAGLSKAFLESITEEKVPDELPALDDFVPSQGPHKLEATADGEPAYPSVHGILPVGEVMNEIPAAFGAICLNESGMQLFQASGALSKYFDIFLSPVHVRAMEDEGQTAASIGNSFDELARHHPRLKSQILRAVMNMLRRLRDLCNILAEKKHSGAKIWENRDGMLTIAGGLAALKGPSHADYEQALSGANDFLPTKGSQPFGDASDEDDHDQAPSIPFISALFKFLEGFFQNNSMCALFCEDAGAELLLDLAISSSVPYDLVSFPLFNKITAVFKVLCEARAHLVLPSIIRRLQFSIMGLKDIIHNQGHTSSFSSFTDLAEPTQSPFPDGRDATTVVKSFVNSHLLTFVLGRTLSPSNYTLRHSNQNHHLFANLNFTDIYIELVDELSKLHAACVWEGLLLMRKLSEEAKSETEPRPFVHRRVDANGVVEHVDKRDSEVHRHGSTGPNGAADTKEMKSKDAILSKKNLRTIRYLVSQLPMGIESFFHSLGQAIVTKRVETSVKQHAMVVADHLAQALIWQLDFRRTEPDDEPLVMRYAAGMLSMFSRMLLRTSYSGDTVNSKEAVAMVMVKFYLAGGFAKMNHYLDLFVQLLAKQGGHEKADSHVKDAIQAVLGFYSQVVRSKCINETPQAQYMLQREKLHGDFFVPGQLVVELRDAVLPAVSRIWHSKEVEMVGDNNMRMVVDILRLILKAEGEDRALRRSDRVMRHVFANGIDFKLRSLEGLQKLTQDMGFDAQLSREALYRCSNQVSTAEAYCRIRLKDSRVPRFPVRHESDGTNAPAHPATGSRTSNAEPSSVASASEGSQDVEMSGASGVAQTSVDMEDANDRGGLRTEEITLDADGNARLVLSSDNDGISDDDDDDVEVGTLGRLPPDLRTEDLSAMADRRTIDILNAAMHKSSRNTKQPYVTLDDLDDKRKALRDDLIERCLDVLSTHPNITFELADLIQAAVAKADEAANPRADIGTTLVSSLMSLQAEEPSKESGRKIHAYAHLVALILQEREFFVSTLDDLKEYFENLVSWVQLEPDQKTEDAPWIEMVLLIIERVLAEDEQPIDVAWEPPSPEDPLKPIPKPSAPELVVPSELRSQLFDALIDLLPKIGKSSSLALSVARVLVVLTRRRDLAARLSDKHTMGRLFLMIRQLAGAVDEKLRGSFMLILRHMIEDDESIRQTMRAEIRVAFENARSSRGLDTTSYTRNLYHLALRNADIFVEVTQEMLEISRFDGHAHRPQHLSLRKNNSTPSTTSAPQSNSNDEAPQATTEGEVSEIQKPTEPKVPVVESTDGVVQFLLRELSNYRDVEDKPPQPPKENEGDKPADGSGSNDVEMSDAPSDRPSQRTRELANRLKPTFKPEEHTIYIYRCFILQCLSELLSCYNRTKIEFINFSRKSETQPATPSKPRAGTLNYLLNVLLPVGTLEHRDDLTQRKRQATANWASIVLVALCSKTSERLAANTRTLDATEFAELEPELTFVRKFVLEHALRSFKDALTSSDPLDERYSRLLALGDLFNRMLDEKADLQRSNVVAIGQHASHQQMGRLMYEKNFIGALTSAIAELDLNFPNAKRAVKYILTPLKQLTDLGVTLSQSSDISSGVATSGDDDEISSATSWSEEDEDDREQTPDMYRDSSLGLLDPPGDDEESDSESDDDEDEEMDYDGYDEEMEYEEEPDHDEVVSDEDEDIDGMGQVEGVPGDLEIEVDMMDDDDEDEDDDDEDDDEEDDDADMDADFADQMDEITGDDENASIGEHDDDDGHWDDDGLDFDDSAPVDDGGSPHGGPLEHIAHVIGAEDPSDPGDAGGIVRIDMGDGEEEFFEDEMPPEDEDEEDEPFGDVYEPEIDEEEDEVGLDFDQDPPTALLRHGHHHHLHHHHRGINDVFGMLGGDLRTAGFRSHRSTPNTRDEDGINPLLQRGPGAHRDRDLGDMPARFLGRRAFMPRHGDHLLQDVLDHVGNNGGPGVINVNLTRGMMQEIAQLPPMFAVQHGHGIPRPMIDYDMRRAFASNWPDIIPGGRYFGAHGMTDEMQAIEFRPNQTTNRWQEEARMLFPGRFHEKALRLIASVLRALIPAAMEAKRLREKEEEECRIAKEKAVEEERKKAEAERAEREEQERKEREEREAREREEAEARAREEAERAAEAGTDAQDGSGMEGIEESQPAAEQAQPEAPQAQDPPAERITVSIRGRELDITSLGIDREYIEALPEDMREEVIMAQFAEQRSQQAEAGENPSEISREFLDALPREIQQELIRSEQLERRRRERDEARRRAAQEGAAAQPEEMNNADFMAMLDPGLRQAVLMDADDSVLAALPEEMQAEARALFGDRRPRGGPAGGRGLEIGGARILNGNAGGRAEVAAREASRQRRPVGQMVDKAGVATLLRLMFVSLNHKSKTNLHSILSDVCKNTQNRAEVISILLSILQDGTADVNAVERSFAQLSLRAKQPAGPKTPQPLKRSLTGQQNGSPSSELSPLNIVQQCLGTLDALAHDNQRVSYFFLNEHETSASQKSKLGKKGKARESRVAKFPINALLALLDRKLITENIPVMETLASLLSQITRPLTSLLRKAKEAHEEAAAAAEAEVNTTAEAEVRPETSASDVPMQEAAEVESPAEGAEASTAAADGSAGDSKEEAKKKSKDLKPPEVPEENIRLVVNILAARECSSKTFSTSLDIIKHLSAIPGAKGVFGKELIRQAQQLGQDLLTDLEELAKQINAAQTGTDLQGMALASFSSAGSKQKKLLRALVALDHLFDPKRIPTVQTATASSSDVDQKLKEEILATLYESSTFDKLWNRLSVCLAAIRQRGNMVNVATILLPLIESLMVVCRNSALKETSNAVISPADTAVSTPPPEAHMESLFFNFTEEHRKILNELIRNNAKLMNGNLSVLAKNSKVLEFDNKRNYFSRKLHDRRSETRISQPALQLSVRRDQVFLDSFKSLYYKSGNEIKYGKLNIRFIGEEGIDAGGVSREWFAAMSRQMFNPDYCLFVPVASDRTTFHPNKLSEVNGEHLMFFKFIGRIIGKALYENRVLDCHFSRAVYRRILGKSVSLKDMESLDLDFYKSLVWILENDITDVTFETFSEDVDRFGVVETVDLIPNGRNIAVTEENKQEYVRLVVEYRLIKSVQAQLDHFLEGFHEIIPAELVSIFNEQELELLISGLPDIDVDDWKNNTEYHNYQATSPQIQWFWRAVRSFDKEDKAKLLQFVTGTSKVPLNGFKELEGMNGFAKFNIHRDYSSKEKLPSSHTCFNQLDLPEYESYEHLRQQLYTAITAGSEYFGFA